MHHRRYIRMVEPWDYDNELLVTLCATCHASLEELKSRVGERLDFEPIFSTVSSVMDLIDKDWMTIHAVVKHFKNNPEALNLLAKKIGKEK